MIIDYLCCLNRYRGIHPNLDHAIDYICNTDLTKLSVGKHEIMRDDVFLNIVNTKTVVSPKHSYEYHKYYADLHLDLIGQEKIAITLSPPQDAGKFDDTTDSGPCLVNDGGYQFTLAPDRFAIAFPWEAHLPLVAVDKPAPIHKCIFKIRF